MSDEKIAPVSEQGITAPEPQRVAALVEANDPDPKRIAELTTRIAFVGLEGSPDLFEQIEAAVRAVPGFAELEATQERRRAERQAERERVREETPARIARNVESWRRFVETGGADYLAHWRPGDGRRKHDPGDDMKAVRFIAPRIGVSGSCAAIGETAAEVMHDLVQAWTEFLTTPEHAAGLYGPCPEDPLVLMNELDAETEIVRLELLGPEAAVQEVLEIIEGR